MATLDRMEFLVENSVLLCPTMQWASACPRVDLDELRLASVVVGVTDDLFVFTFGRIMTVRIVFW